jgi:hypothetical protein
MQDWCSKLRQALAQFVSDRYTEYTTYPAALTVLNSEILKLSAGECEYPLCFDQNRMNVFASADNILDKDLLKHEDLVQRS